MDRKPAILSIPATTLESYRRFGIFSCAAVFGAIGLTEILGPFGSLLSIAAALIALRYGAVAGILLIHTGALASNGIVELWAIVLIEVASWLLLIGTYQSLQAWETAILGGLLAAGSGAVALWLIRTEGIETATAGVVLAGGVTVYIVHRYQRVRLGLLTTNE